MAQGDAFQRRGSSYPSTAAPPRRPEHPRSRIDPATSPLVDRVGPGWALSESTSPVLYLSPARRRFLASTAAAGARPILVTGEESSLTLALDEALSSLGGVWVVRSATGYRDTRMGRRIARPEDAFAPDFDPRPAPEHVRPPAAETTQVAVLASIRQRNRRKATYGASLELLADLLVDDAALDWGVAEPVTLPWGLERVGEYGREALSHNPWLVVNGVGATGRAVTATLRLRPTKQGAEEIVNLVADVGPEGGEDAAEALADAPELLAELSLEGVPLIAIVFGRVGRADLHKGPTLERPGAPLAILIGAPGVSRLGLPIAELEARFDARVVGNDRAPSIVVPLGDEIMPQNFARLREVLWALDPVALADALGTDAIEPLLGPGWREEAASRAAAASSPDVLGPDADGPAQEEGHDHAT
ncbi:hypothetical protein GCM10011490_21170 [Pseudoclavibacter endophyticus]|uniref:Uncharacterized protein n=1 Tax=Pseudoclavibacter endophyticus TaxID=1778590 RepID=A0A6H9WN34_9MICO|nr:DUF6177 family protein [Pseudoclavibacter endophyticus]KAB1648168.1 hypothetical protein F8O04_10650 [Pseudoclavibacter endophyticus]GGA70299.1 hypothetical protein GCM10011490_21170 [Pseudoclavibacter endophyticus]